MAVTVFAAVIGGVLANPHNLRDWIAETEALRVSPEFLLAVVYAARVAVILVVGYLGARLLELVIVWTVDRLRARQVAAQRAAARERQRRKVAHRREQERLAKRATLEKVLRAWYDDPSIRDFLLAVLETQYKEFMYDDKIRALEGAGAITYLEDRIDNTGRTWMTADLPPTRRVICELTSDATDIVRKLYEESIQQAPPESD